MSQEKLASAFRLIYDFRSGQFKAGDEISVEQLELLQLLQEDLLPGESFDPSVLDTLIPRLAQIDSLWNKRTMSLADEFYALQAGGSEAEAEQLRSSFMNSCPSSWYRGIAGSL